MFGFGAAHLPLATGGVGDVDEAPCELLALMRPALGLLGLLLRFDLVCLLSAGRRANKQHSSAYLGRLGLNLASTGETSMYFPHLDEGAVIDE